MKKKNNFFINIIYKLQLLGLKLLIVFFNVLGFKLSALFCSILFIFLCPFIFFRHNILAYKNITIAFPEKNFFQKIFIIIGMWNHFGRCFGEFIFFGTKSYKKLQKYIKIDEKTKKILNQIAKNKEGEIIFTAHFGNWECFTVIFPYYNIPISALYRPMNNKYVDNLVYKYRIKPNNEMILKGRKGVIKIVKALKNGRKLYMLMDQRLRSGVNVPFFNRNAKTSDSLATFSLKNHYKVYSIRAIRKKFYSSVFDIKIDKFKPINTNNFKKDVIKTTIKMNKTIESWIKERPEQWFWVHNRWKE